MKKIVFVIVIMLVIIFLNKDVDQVMIPADAIRFRVIASSNSVCDQKLKYDIKDNLIKDVPILFSGVNSLINSKNTLSSNLENIKTSIRNTLAYHNKDIEYNVALGLNNFPQKIHNGVILPKGDHESLVITLGDGKGDNFWCILFPPLCLLDRNENLEETEYKLFVREILNRHF